MDQRKWQAMKVMAGEDKAAVRRELLLRRRSMGRVEWLEKSAAAQGVLTSIAEVQLASSVHCYVSMEAEREVSTSGLLEWFCTERKMVYMPYIERGRMVSARYRSCHDFTFRKAGPPVPYPLVIADEAVFDVVIVPLVGADRKGRRLGYGKGWYDRFFENLSTRGIHPLRIGLAFGFQVLEEIPSDPWDQLLDMVVTEIGTINCMNGRA